MNSTNNTAYQTLEAIATADRFNRWMYETVAVHCQGKILEIGSGIGNISGFFIREGHLITLSDTEDFYINHLKKKFDGVKVVSIDLVHENFLKEYEAFFQSFDTVVFLNVLEHISSDDQAIQNCAHFLKTGGTMVILVPAFSFLYSKMDRELEHCRRYTSKKLASLISRNKLVVRKVFYFNALGMLGWMYNKLFRQDSISTKKMKAFNFLVPAAKLIDKIIFHKAGLSVIMIAQKDL